MLERFAPSKTADLSFERVRLAFLRLAKLKFTSFMKPLDKSAPCKSAFSRDALYKLTLTISEFSKFAPRKLQNLQFKYRRFEFDRLVFINDDLDKFALNKLELLRSNPERINPSCAALPIIFFHIFLPQSDPPETRWL